MRSYFQFGDHVIPFENVAAVIVAPKGAGVAVHIKDAAVTINLTDGVQAKRFVEEYVAWLDYWDMQYGTADDVRSD